ncbi:MAG: diguanylate cyclase [Zoogloeaceae bacterium]|nr:diguanylate cyclase [Zoogloeaceae bacterium]
MTDLRRILIVDDSRMVRTSLSRHLAGVYEIREEENGESAWQSLVLDHSIEAVISDLQMPVLDGFGLLERVRSCKLKRLREIPFVLISGDDDTDVMERAERMGVSDFINKGVSAAELKTRLGNLLQFVDTWQSLEEARTTQTQDPNSGLFTRRYIELQTAQALSHAFRRNTTVSLIIIGFDRYSEMVEQLGEHKASEISLRFAQQVASKVRREDSLGHFLPGCFAIVSPDTSPESCVVFADRLRRAVADAVIVSGGKRLNLTMSIGIASVPGDKVTAAGTLIDLAYERMESVVAAGGNGTKYGIIDPAATVSPLNIEQALKLLRARRPEAVLQQLEQLYEHLLPLLTLLQDELGVNLQLDELHKKLQQRDQGH